MTNRGNVGGALLTIAMTAALWAWSGGVASAQCDGECPGPIVPCPDPGACTGEGCGSFFCSGTYFPGQRANVFTFGPDNSLQVKFADVPEGCFFNLDVRLIPTDNMSGFHPRVKSSVCTPPDPLFDDGLGTPEITCNETVVLDVNGIQTNFCAVYRVSQPSNTCWIGPIDYIVGWAAPAKGNKHDFFLLRDPDELDPDNNGNMCFSQNITTGTLIRNYTPGELRDPGLGGRTCCPSDYVVARQRIRPVGK